VSELLHTTHSLLRYGVLLAAVGVMIAAALAWRRPPGTAEPDRTAMTVFVALVDVQVLLGIVLFVVWPYYPMLIGHIVMMVLAAGAAHGGSVMARRRAPERSGAPVRLVTAVVVLVLIVGGIMAIQRPVL
jgi:hypothetical protein